MQKDPTLQTIEIRALVMKLEQTQELAEEQMQLGIGIQLLIQAL